jgi:hypothetical protein
MLIVLAQPTRLQVLQIRDSSVTSDPWRSRMLFTVFLVCSVSCAGQHTSRLLELKQKNRLWELTDRACGSGERFCSSRISTIFSNHFLWQYFWMHSPAASAGVNRPANCSY